VVTQRRRIITLFATLLCALVAAQTYAGETYIAGNYVARSPSAELRTLDEARQLANRLLEETPGSFIVRGTGNSMRPLYTSGTLLVVKPVAFEELARGMSVVFRQDNRNIAHVLVAKTKDGWRTTGVNNRRNDYMSVNADNIRGVIIAAYTPVSRRVAVMR
jgi:phage repressor protein C with HTH and peptisase S24 domain